MASLHHRYVRRLALGALLLLAVFGRLRVGAAEPILLNFKSVELNALVQVVAEVTGRNFVVDPRVKAEVTAISATPLEPDELYQVFLCF